MKLALLLMALTSSVSASTFDPNNYSTDLKYAQVTYVKASQSKDGSWCFDTTVRHNDQGWEHYANSWEVIDLEGNQLGYRQLAHPHVHEQPFTRSQCGIQIPKTITKIAVRATCNQQDFGGKAVVVDLSTSKGADYSVNRSK